MLSHHFFCENVGIDGRWMTSFLQGLRGTISPERHYCSILVCAARQTHNAVPAGMTAPLQLLPDSYFSATALFTATAFVLDFLGVRQHQERARLRCSQPLLSCSIPVSSHFRHKAHFSMKCFLDHYNSSIRC